MHKIGARSSLAIFLIAAVAFSGIVLWLLHHQYGNDFALSRWAKVVEVLGAEQFRFEYLGLLYPHFPIYALIPFYHLPGLRDVAAPYLLSVLIGAGLLALWNQHLAQKGYGLGLRLLLIALVAVHPFFLWSMTTGSQNALSLVMFYLLYLAISRLIHEQDTRSFIALAVVLAVYFFVDERTSYLFIGLLPLIPLIVPRRMLAESITSVYVIIAAPLLIVMLSWAYLSWIFQDDAWVFLSSPASAFRGAFADAPYVPWLRLYGGTYLASLAAILVTAALAFPVLLWLLYHSARHALLLRATIVLFAHPIIAATLASANYFLAHPADMLFLFGAGYMAGTVLIPRESPKARAIMLVLLVAGCIGGWATFLMTPTADMDRWQQALRTRLPDSAYDADRELARWLDWSSAPTLIDDRLGYRAVAFRSDTSGLILPFSKEFKLALMQRPLTVPQVAVPDPRPGLGGQDLINQRFPELYQKGLPGYRLVYDHGHWRVYRRNDAPDA